jgi:hypothetical protein
MMAEVTVHPDGIVNVFLKYKVALLSSSGVQGLPPELFTPIQAFGPSPGNTHAAVQALVGFVTTTAGPQPPAATSL